MFTRPAASVTVIAALLLAGAAAQRSAGEYELKAVFLLNFTRFCEWPADAFDGPDAPFVVCTLGDNPFGDTLVSTFANERWNGHPYETRTVDGPSDARCHLLFVPATETDVFARDIAGWRAQPLVSVGEHDDFLRVGGTINLFVADRRIQFEVNSPAEPAAPRISSRLLRLARRVYPGGRP